MRARGVGGAPVPPLLLLVVTTLLLAIGTVAVLSDGVQRSSSNHRLRHGRGGGSETGREQRSPAGGDVTSEVTAAVGDDVTLDCGNARVSVTSQWYHDGRSTTASERLLPRPYGQLVLLRLRVADAGLWHCRDPTEVRSRPTGSRAVLLKVYASPEAPRILLDDSPPSAGEPVNVVENMPVTLTCVSERSLPPAAVTWFLGKPEVNVTGQSRTVTQSSGGGELYSTRSHLTLNVSRAMADERVTCVTWHRQLHVRQHTYVQLNVQYPPRFTVIRTPVFGNPILQGMRVNLTCVADANPPVQPLWIKDDSVPRVLNNNGTILFNPIDTEDTGWYRCLASHLGTNVSSYSYYLHVRDESSGDDSPYLTVQTTVGAPVSLKCDGSEPDRSRGTPCWVKENAATGQADVASRGHRMHLDGATYEDTGVFSCQMPPITEEETQRRARARSFFVKVTGKPMVSNISLSSEPVLGQPVTLHVRFCADPPPQHLLWAVGHLAARPGHRSPLAQASAVSDGNVNSCFTASLHVMTLRPELTGDVTVMVTNQLGTDQLTRRVDASRRSHSTFGGVSAARAGGVGAIATVVLIVMKL